MKKTNDAFSESQALIRAILQKMGGFSKPRLKFLEHIFLLLMGLFCRYTFLNLGRFGSYSERSYRNHYGQDFDFLGFNTQLALASKGSDFILAFDPSHLPKSGRHTAHVGLYYHGVSKRRLPGLELGVLSLIDRKRKTAFPLEAIQSHLPAKLKEAGKSQVDQYAEIIIERREDLEKLSSYLVVDGYFAKKKYLDLICEQTNLQVITLLRKDANLRYLYQAPDHQVRGRPRKYDGKVDQRELDPNKVEKVHEDEEKIIYAFIAYAPRLKRKLRVLKIEWKKEGKRENPYSLYASTDPEIDPMTLFEMYTERFQIEFLIRDAKQYVGLEHVQARDEKKLHFHFNAAFTCVGIAKVIMMPKDQISRFSMANWKTQFHNHMMLQIFFANFGVNQSHPKNIPIIEKIIKIGTIAA